MRTLKVSKIWISAFLLAVLAAGCGDPDKGAGNPGNPLTPPTVTFVTPPDGSTVFCPNTTIITATFSKAMNPATINSPATTFTLANTLTSANVAGTVNYIVATNIATFTPSSALATNTKFTATISTGVADTFGNHLAANFVWTFTTPGPCGAPGGINLGTACGFGILAATPSVTNTGNTVVTGAGGLSAGDVGISPAASIVGFPPGTLTGMKRIPPDPLVATAQTDLTTAFNNAMNAGGGPGVGTVLSPDIGGQTLVPGIYTTTVTNPTLGITGDLTLSGNGVYIFKVQTALTTADGSLSAPASRIILSGGATSHDVFWQIGSAATLGTFSTFQGTIMANATITLKTGATLNGRALDRSAAVTLDTNPVNVPPCP